MKRTFLTLALLGWVFAPEWSSAEVSKVRKLATRASAHCQAPVWSPDGTKLAYEVYDPKKDRRETWIMDMSPDGRRQGESEVKTGMSVASGILGGKKAPIVEFAWAPDMKMLSKPYVFSSPGPNKNFDLFLDGGWMTKNPGNDGQPDWSADGRFIAYTSQRKASGDIFVIDLHNDPEKPLRATQWADATEFRPKWSPRDSHLLFTRSQMNSKGQDIGMVTDVTQAKETLKMITEWDGDEIRPNWSPDGSKIAFYSNKGRKNNKIFDLWVVDKSGANSKKLATDVVVDDNGGAVWTKDSSAILFVKRDFKTNNPVQWVRIDSGVSGTLKTGTQLNSDLAIRERDGAIQLVFRALGEVGAGEKTWQRLYTVTFSMADVGGGQP